MSRKKAISLRNLFLSFTIIFGVLALLCLVLRITGYYLSTEQLQTILEVIRIDMLKVLKIAKICMWLAFGFMVVFEALTVFIYEWYIYR